MIRKTRKLFYVMVIMKKNVQRALGAAFLLFITVIGIYSGNVLMIVCTILASVIILFFCRGMSTDQEQRLVQDIIRTECQYFTESETELQQKLAEGKLRFLVEWWEKDEFFIPENGHLLFIFSDSTSFDFYLHRETVDKLAPLLSRFGIEWKCRYQCDFSSRILFPPPYAGQPFYTSKGSVRDDIEL